MPHLSIGSLPIKPFPYGRKPAGATRLTRLFLTYINNGDLSFLYAAVKDVTVQKQTELELENYRLHLEDLVTIRTKELEEAKQVAETANHAKSTFLANMSHEIRTPLNAIIGFAHLIGNQVHTPEQQSKVGKIIDSGKHLLGIINDILALSKIEAKSMQLEERTFWVSTTLDQTSSMMRERVVEKRLDLVIEHDPRFAKLPVKGDELRLRQILVNYLGNAVKFTGSQSTFQHMLGKFIEQQPDLPERIERAIQSEDFETAQRNAHSLKGVAAMLGMKELGELALSLEQLLRHHTEQKEIEIATGLHLLTTELGVVLKEANEISQSYSQENDSIDLPHLQSLVLKLHQQLTNNNPEAADTWQTIEPIFCKVLEACDYDLLKEQLEQGVYPEALIPLEEIREEYEEIELLNNQG